MDVRPAILIALQNARPVMQTIVVTELKILFLRTLAVLLTIQIARPNALHGRATMGILKKEICVGLQVDLQVVAPVVLAEVHVCVGEHTLVSALLARICVGR